MTCGVSYGGFPGCLWSFLLDLFAQSSVKDSFWLLACMSGLDHVNPETVSFLSCIRIGIKPGTSIWANVCGPNVFVLI